MSRPDDVELPVLAPEADVDNAADVDLQGLPPVDFGKHAYLTLAACFFLEAAVWGYSRSSHHMLLY